MLRGVGGLGSAMFSVSAQALLLASVPGGQRGRASGLYTGGFLLGGITGPALGGVVAAWSLRAPFFLYGALLVVPAVIAAAAFGSTARPRRAARAAASLRESLAVLAGALRSRAYRAVAAVNFADGFAVLGVRGAIIPLFVRDSLHRPATWTGIGFLVFAALNGAALLPAGRVADTLGRRPVMVAGCAISAAGLLLLAVLPGLWAYLGALAVAGAGSGLLDVAPSAMLGDLLSAQARQDGILVAFFQMAGDAGAVTGPVVAGLLVDSVSYPAAFVLAGGVLAAAALLAVLTPEGPAPASGRLRPGRAGLMSEAEQGLELGQGADRGQAGDFGQRLAAGDADRGDAQLLGGGAEAGVVVDEQGGLGRHPERVQRRGVDLRRPAWPSAPRRTG